MTLVLCIALALAQPNPTASDAWAAIGRDGSVAVYATINNPSMYDIYLTSAASPAAGTIELIADGKPASSITVPAYGSVELKAGGPFVRLSALKSELNVGDEVKLTISTDGGIDITMAAVVKSP